MKHIINMQYERGFNFLLQHVDCDTEQRSGNLTFPKGTKDTWNTRSPDYVINYLVSI